MAFTDIETTDTPNEGRIKLNANFADAQTQINAKAATADLGTAAASDAGDFATAAQGAKADTAVQPAAIADFVTGDGITDIVKVTESEYAGLTPDAATLYVVVADP